MEEVKDNKSDYITSISDIIRDILDIEKKLFNLYKIKAITTIKIVVKLIDIEIYFLENRLDVLANPMYIESKIKEYLAHLKEAKEKNEIARVEEELIKVTYYKEKYITKK